MNIHEHMGMTGRLIIQQRDQSGQIIQEQSADNAIVLDGRDLVAKLFRGETSSNISQLAVGTGGGSVAPGDNALVSEILRKPLKPFDASKDLITDATDPANPRKLLRVSIDLETSDTPANTTQALNEAALFNDDNVMYNRVVFPVVNKTDDIKLTLIWEITF